LRGSLNHEAGTDNGGPEIAIGAQIPNPIIIEPVDGGVDAIVAKNLDGVIQTWNDGAQRMIGYTQEEAIGQPITLIIPPELREEESEILRRLRVGKRIEHYETRRVAKDGRTIDVSVGAPPSMKRLNLGPMTVLKPILPGSKGRRDMSVNVNEIIRKMSSAERKKKVEDRAAEIIAEEMSLRDLRKARKLTQARVAKKLGIAQDSVSRLEKRSDLLISTLRKAVKAMGGDVRIVAEFPDRAPVLLSELSEDEPSRKSRRRHAHARA
jgi:PAS domain S-box-containing protein